MDSRAALLAVGASPLAVAAFLAVGPAVLKFPSPQGVRRPWCPPPLASAATPIKLLRTDSGLSPAVIVLHPLGFVLLQLLVPLSRMLAQAYVSVGLVIQGALGLACPVGFPQYGLRWQGPSASDGRAVRPQHQCAVARPSSAGRAKLVMKGSSDPERAIPRNAYLKR